MALVQTLMEFRPIGWFSACQLIASLFFVFVIYKFAILLVRKRASQRHFDLFPGPRAHWLFGHVLEVLCMQIRNSSLRFWRRWATLGFCHLRRAMHSILIGSPCAKIHNLMSSYVFSSSKTEQTLTSWWILDDSTPLLSLCSSAPFSTFSTFTIQIMWKRYWDQQVQHHIHTYIYIATSNSSLTAVFNLTEPKDDFAYEFIESWIGKDLQREILLYMIA